MSPIPALSARTVPPITQVPVSRLELEELVSQAILRREEQHERLLRSGAAMRPDAIFPPLTRALLEEVASTATRVAVGDNSLQCNGSTCGCPAYQAQDIAYAQPGAATGGKFEEADAIGSLIGLFGYAFDKVVLHDFLDERELPRVEGRKAKVVLVVTNEDGPDPLPLPDDDLIHNLEDSLR